jgi:hypothetical protein
MVSLGVVPGNQLQPGVFQCISGPVNQAPQDPHSGYLSSFTERLFNYYLASLLIRFIPRIHHQDLQSITRRWNPLFILDYITMFKNVKIMIMNIQYY